MGCFSYICPKCKNPIFSDKYGNCIGEEVYLGLLIDGKIVEEMFGKYDSYGKVHTDKDSFHKLNGKLLTVPTLDCNGSDGHHVWIYDFGDKIKTWGRIVDLHFDRNEKNGIVAVHKKCWDGKFPSEQSKDDPNQGWRDYENDDGEIE